MTRVATFDSALDGGLYVVVNSCLHTRITPRDIHRDAAPHRYIAHRAASLVWLAMPGHEDS